MIFYFNLIQLKQLIALPFLEDQGFTFKIQIIISLVNSMDVQEEDLVWKLSEKIRNGSLEPAKWLF